MCEAVPIIWLNSRKNKCKWPSSNVSKNAKKYVEPQDDWTLYNARIIGNRVFGKFI